MKLTVEQVRHVASLARLSLSAVEEQQALAQLQQVLDAFAVLDTVDLTDVPATAQVHLEASPLRADEPGPTLGVARALANAPQPIGTSFGVPKIIE